MQSLPTVTDSNIGAFTKLVVSKTLDFSSAKIDVSLFEQFNLEEQMLFGKYSLPNPTSRIFYIKTSDEVCDQNYCYGYLKGEPQFRDGSHPSFDSLGKRVAARIASDISDRLINTTKNRD